MDFSQIFDVVKLVLKDSRVIFIFIIVFLYLNFTIYIVKYKKKPSRPKIKKSIPQETPIEAEKDASDEGEDS